MRRNISPTKESQQKIKGLIYRIGLPEPVAKVIGDSKVEVTAHDRSNRVLDGIIIPKRDGSGHILVTDKEGSWNIFYGSVYSFRDIGGQIDSYQGAIQNLEIPDRVHQISFRKCCSGGRQ